MKQIIFPLTGLLLCTTLLASACTTEDPRVVYAPPPAGDDSDDDAPRPMQDGAIDETPDAAGQTNKPDAALPNPDASADASAAPSGPSCGEAPVQDGVFSRKALRKAAVTCATWHFCEFETVARALDDAVVAYASKSSEKSLQLARDAWRAAMDVWSEIELFQFGPLSSRAESAGKDLYHGEGIRDRIYSWPLAARCRVEEQLFSQDYKTKGLDGALVSGRGLFALEYLLFYEGQDTACAPLTEAGAGWSKISATELAKRKLDYAQALTKDIVSRAQTLISTYSADGDHFSQTFIDATGYPNEQEAMNVLAWSLVYVEKEVKDYKLGVPAGFTLASSVSTKESPFAGADSANIRANLRGFRGLFQGCGAGGEGIGFDDWLTAAEHGDLARDMIAALDDAEKTLAKLPPLDDASPAELTLAYEKVKALTDLLKGEFFASPLNLKRPNGIEGDTD